MATVNVKLIPEFYACAVVLIKQWEEIGEKQFLCFGLKGGQDAHGFLAVLLDEPFLWLFVSPIH